MSGIRTKIQKDTQIKIVGDVNVNKRLKNIDDNEDEDATITG